MIDIRLATTSEELNAVYNFRYTIYVEEMGQNESYADHQHERIVDTLGHPYAKVLAAWDGNTIVGTTRSNFVHDGSIDNYLGYYQLQHLSREQLSKASISTHCMVHPAFRRTTLTARLVSETYQRGLDEGLQTNYCDCAPHNIPFFTGLGYSVIDKDFVHPEFGLGSVMKLNMHDVDWLERVRSPFRKVLSTHLSRQRKEVTPQ